MKVKKIETKRARKVEKNAKKLKELKVTENNTVRETEKAVLVECIEVRIKTQFDRMYNKYHNELFETIETWIPKSQIDEKSSKVSRWFRKEANDFDDLYNKIF